MGAQHSTTPDATVGLPLILLGWSLLGAAGCARPAATADPRAELRRGLEQVRAGRTTRLELRGPLNDDDLRALATLGDQLQALSVERSTVTDEGIVALEACRRLESLRLRGAAVGDGGLRTLAGLPHLRILNLPQARFSDQGLAELARAAGKLELLRFGSPAVTDDGVEQLSRLASLRFLHLINVPVTDRGLKSLHGLTQLESLYLDGSRVTDAGVAALLAALPELHLHLDQRHHDFDPRAHDHVHR